jgi:8-oxo-dGTP pyrophosphatase MutT (NUDIX family)
LHTLNFDPSAIPVESIAGEPAISENNLSAEWLRDRFAHPHDWIPERVDEQRRAQISAAPVPAAVLMPIVAHGTGLSLLLTQRTAHLHDHAGQISLPGGRVDHSDTSVIETALRETKEEIGLARSHIEVLGALPDYFTGTGFRVTPIVAIVQPPFELSADPFEVAEIFEVPLSFLMNGMNHQRRTMELPNGARRTFYAMPYEHHFIWGATASMLRNLFHYLRA